MPDYVATASGQWEPKTPIDASQTGWLRWLENSVLCVALAALVVLPLLEIVLRATLQTGVSGSNALIQHMTLVIGMLGGAVAARENRLLALSTGAFLKGRLKLGAALFSGAVAATISLFLAVASYQFVLTEKEAGSILAYNVPVWLIQCVMPIGFGLVAVRLLYYAGEAWKLRVLTAGLTGILTLLALRLPVPPAEAVTPALIGLLVATALGSPVFATLGGAALDPLLGRRPPHCLDPIGSLSSGDQPLVADDPALHSGRLFSGRGWRLSAFGKGLSRALWAVSWRTRDCDGFGMRLLHLVYGSFGGDHSGFGWIADAILLTAGYPPKSALGLLTGAGSLGLLFPPMPAAHSVCDCCQNQY
jgi:TRAP-type C4-dicarboxylate transport system permease small subunit